MKQLIIVVYLNHHSLQLVESETNSTPSSTSTQIFHWKLQKGARCRLFKHLTSVRWYKCSTMLIPSSYWKTDHKLVKQNRSNKLKECLKARERGLFLIKNKLFPLKTYFNEMMSQNFTSLDQSLALQIGICLLIVNVTLTIFIFFFKIGAPLVHSLSFLNSLP